jgi:hypothetical protein
MRMLRAVARSTVAPKVAMAVVAGAALLSFVPAANAVSYSTTDAPTQLSLGDAIGPLSNYDWLSIYGTSGTLTPGKVLLNKLVFTAGVNAYVPQVYNNIYSFAETITIGTGSRNLVVPFNLNISYSDTLTIVGGTTLSILDGTSIWNIVVDPLTIGPNAGGSMPGYLYAQVSDPPNATPLPAALPLFATGLGVMGLFGWRRKRKASVAVAA